MKSQKSRKGHRSFIIFFYLSDGRKDDDLHYSISDDGKILNIYSVGKVHESASINWYVLNDVGFIAAPKFTLKTEPRPGK